MASSLIYDHFAILGVDKNEIDYYRGGGTFCVIFATILANYGRNIKASFSKMDLKENEGSELIGYGEKRREIANTLESEGTFGKESKRRGKSTVKLHKRMDLLDSYSNSRRKGEGDELGLVDVRSYSIDENRAIKKDSKGGYNSLRTSENPL